MSEGIQARRIRRRKWNECARNEAAWTPVLRLDLRMALPARLVPASGRFPASQHRAKQRQRGRTTTGITTAAPHDPNNASVSIGWILRDQAPPNRLDSDSPPPHGRVPQRPCPIRPSIPQPVPPRTQATVPLLASECMKCTAGERTQAEPIVTRHSQVQREAPSTRYNPYTPPSPPPAMSQPAGPPASYNGPAVRPVGPPPSYQGPSSSRESVSRSQSGSSDSGASNQESRGAARGRTGR